MNAPASQQQAAPLRVLVVDDDPRIVRTTCDILGIKKLQVSGAGSGEEGVAKFAAERPDCVLMDIKMPGMSGVEALKRMKSIAPSVPVILVSAYATHEAMDEARQAGAFAILDKPLNIPAVLAFLELLRKQERVILMAGEDRGLQQAVREALGTQGMLVTTARSAEEVMAGLEREHCLAVLIEFGPGADSLDLLAQIRGRYPSKPVVLVSARGEQTQDAVAAGLRLGAHAILERPVEPATLRALIEEIRSMKLRNVLIAI